MISSIAFHLNWFGFCVVELVSKRLRDQL